MEMGNGACGRRKGLMGTIAQFAHLPAAWARVITLRNIETWRIQLFQSQKIGVIFGSFKKRRLNRASNFHSFELQCIVNLWQQIKNQYAICRPEIAVV